MNKIYIILRNNQHEGPYSVDEIAGLFINEHDFVKIVGSKKGWQYAGDIPELNNHLVGEGASVASLNISASKLLGGSGSAKDEAPPVDAQNGVSTQIHTDHDPEKFVNPKPAVNSAPVPKQDQKFKKPVPARKVEPVAPAGSQKTPVFVEIAAIQPAPVEPVEATPPEPVFPAPPEREIIPITSLKSVGAGTSENNPVFMKQDDEPVVIVATSENPEGKNRSKEDEVGKDIPATADSRSPETLSFDERIERIKRSAAAFKKNNEPTVNDSSIGPSESQTAEALSGMQVTPVAAPGNAPNAPVANEVITPKANVQLKTNVRKAPVFVSIPEPDKTFSVGLEGGDKPAERNDILFDTNRPSIENRSPDHLDKFDPAPLKEPISFRQDANLQNDQQDTHGNRLDQSQTSLVGRNSPDLNRYDASTNGLPSERVVSGTTGDIGSGETLSFDERIEKVRQAAVTPKNRIVSSKAGAYPVAGNPTLLELAKKKPAGEPAEQPVTGNKPVLRNKPVLNKRKLAVGASLLLLAAIWFTLPYLKKESSGVTKSAQSSTSNVEQGRIAASDAAVADEGDLIKDLPVSELNKNEVDKTVVKEKPTVDSDTEPAVVTPAPPVATSRDGLLSVQSENDESNRAVAESTVVLNRPAAKAVVAENKAPAVTEQIFLKPEFSTNENAAGIFNVSVSLQNKSDKILKTVAVNLFFNDDAGRVLNKQTLYFTEVKPGETMSRAASQHKLATKASCELGLVSSEGVLYYAN
jgi:hypothetical protein